MSRRLPRIVVAVVTRAVADPLARDGLLGDLEERYQARANASAPRRALWLLAEVAGVLANYTRHASTREARDQEEEDIVDSLVQDLRFAVRAMLRRPGFSALVVLTLALGIGANTAIFSVVDGLLIEPLPFSDADELVLINQRNEDTGFTSSVSLPNYRDWKERARSFAEFAAIMPGSGALTTGDGTRMLEIGWVVGGFFETLSVEPALGRFFTAAESEPGAERLLVLSHGLWESTFGADPGVVGRPITLYGEPYVVVGVAPPDFPLYPATEAWAPMGYMAPFIAWDDRQTSSGTEVIARLAPGATLEQARSELDAIGRELAAEEGQAVGRGNPTALRRWYLGDAGRQAMMLMAAVALVLFVACANVANLLFVRGATRQEEISLRVALGAARGRVHRQLATEALVFGLLGGVAGAVLGALALRGMLAYTGTTLPPGFAERIGIDGTVLGFTAGLALLTAVLAGSLPALRTAEAALGSTLRSSARGGRRGTRTRRVLVAGEVALSMVLLVGAGLLITSLRNLQVVDKGFDADEVVTVRVQAPRARYTTRELWADFHARVRDEVSALPGVVSVASSNHFPLSGNSWEMLLKDERTPAGERGPSVLLTMVSPEYFDAYDIEIVEGRGFGEADRWGSEEVAIVDETLAAARWPGESAIGKRITFEQLQDANGDYTIDLWRRVVGVARHVRHYELTSPSRIEVYAPLAQSAAWGFTAYLSVKATDDPGSLVPAIRRIVADLDPDAPLYRIRTMESVLNAELGAHRAMRQLLSIFAALTLLLGAVGIYSVVSHTTALRVRELGVRIALGGEPGRMVAMVLRDSMPPVLAGLAVGAALAAGLGRVLGSLLFEVRPAEPGVLATAAVTMLAVATLSTWVPALRAARVQPTDALRME